MADELPAEHEVTRLIHVAREGDAAAKNRLFELVYSELQAIARRRPGVGKPGDTMQATALVNEAYLFFEKHFPIPPRNERENRETFFCTVALAMRAILKDYWRAKRSKKRGGDEEIVAYAGQEPARDELREFDQVDFLALDEAMNRLEGRSARWFGVVMHRYFAGRSVEETAELMGISPATVKSDWALARAWLHRFLGGGEAR